MFDVDIDVSLISSTSLWQAASNYCTGPGELHPKTTAMYWLLQCVLVWVPCLPACLSGARRKCSLLSTLEIRPRINMKALQFRSWTTSEKPYINSCSGPAFPFDDNPGLLLTDIALLTLQQNILWEIYANEMQNLSRKHLNKFLQRKLLHIYLKVAEKHSQWNEKFF